MASIGKTGFDTLLVASRSIAMPKKPIKTSIGVEVPNA